MTEVVVREGTKREIAATGITEDGIPWINATGDAYYDKALPQVDRVSREIASWISQTRSGGGRARPPSLINRVAYVAPESPYAQMQTAKMAVDNDDVVSGVADVTEGLMLQGLKWESEDAESADIFNQIARDLNMDDLARQWHLEDFTYSQAVIGLWWGPKDYKYRGTTETGRKSKKTKRVWAPLAWTFLDPMKVVPLQQGPFGQDRLAWYATKEEFAAATPADGVFADPVLREFTTGSIFSSLSAGERSQLAAWGIDPRRLLGLNPALVFRVTKTKASYQRFANLRLKSVFPLLDLKQQLIEADRVNLVGAANFILLVRQGSKEEPAKQEEVDNLKENFKVVAKLPVVVGDHRLSIDIITPDQEHVLDTDKYDTIDRRILSRTLGALTISTGRGGGTGSAQTMTRGISRMLENRRHMFKRALEERVARAIVDHPGNAGIFENEPNIAFTPKNVQLDSDAEVARAVLALRTQNEISRESVLEHFGFDQAVEHLRRMFEKDNYDDDFQTRVPFDGQGGGPTDGGDGRPPGGGDSPQSPQGQSGGRTATGTKKTTK